MINTNQSNQYKNELTKANLKRLSKSYDRHKANP